MSSVARNAPCPCGSGKKYKRCHLGVEDFEAPGASSRTGALAWIAIAVVSVAVGAGVGFLKGPTTGVALGLAVGLLLVIVRTIMRPPPSRGGGDPGAINFGT